MVRKSHWAVSYCKPDRFGGRYATPQSANAELALHNLRTIVVCCLCATLLA